MANDNIKKLVIFFSLNGNSKFVAENIAKKIGADTLELKMKKGLPKTTFFKLFIGGMQVMLKKKPELFPFDKDPNNYDFIIFGTPVWASSYTSPFNTFFSQTQIKGKKIGLYCCCGGSQGKTFENMKNALQGNSFLGELELKMPLKDKEGNIRKVDVWVKELAGKI